MEVEEVLGRLRVDKVGCGSVEGGMVGCRGCDWRIRVCVCVERALERCGINYEKACVWKWQGDAQKSLVEEVQRKAQQGRG